MAVDTTSFTGFRPEAIQFLADLTENNSRDWFQPRKANYERLLKEPLAALCVALDEAFRARDIPLEADEQGEVTVSRTLGGVDIQCKEIVFSVEHAKQAGTTREFYTATVCRDGAEWKWATAEPATERWGALQ
jgi:hypothetical protein